MKPNISNNKKYKFLMREYEPQKLNKMSNVEVLLCNGTIRLKKRSWSHTFTKPYTQKVNIAFRLIVYAFYDLLDTNDKNIYRAKLLKQIDDKKQEYLQRIRYRIQADGYEQRKRGRTATQLFQEVELKSKKLYNSNIESGISKALYRIFNYYWDNEYKTFPSNYKQLILPTRFGKELYKKIQEGYVF